MKSLDCIPIIPTHQVFLDFLFLTSYNPHGHGHADILDVAMVGDALERHTEKGMPLSACNIWTKRKMRIFRHMKRSKIKRITLRESRTKTDHSIWEAMIKDNGDLAVEGYDIGKAPLDFWGDSDYEYGRTIKKKYKHKILRLLIEQQFKSNSDFQRWLDEKGIPGKPEGKIARGYEDTTLLWLIKEKFNLDSDFKDWLVESDIPDEYWSWI